MKKLIILTCSLLIACTTAVKAHNDEPHRKKVGLVLAGGGAKGAAHVGVIKVLEKAGIPIDIVTGTSIGSIVGGLYSMGYDAALMDSIFRDVNWGYVLRDRVAHKRTSLDERENQSIYILDHKVWLDKSANKYAGGFIKGINVDRMLDHFTSGYHDSIDFNRLPRPFACVAFNLMKNEETVLRSGHLAKAIRASMAIPGVFSPVRKDSMVLVDGGVSNNLPVDVAKAMGADIIIAVTLQDEAKINNDFNSFRDIVLQSVFVASNKRMKECLQMADLHINVNTHGYDTQSFTNKAIDSLIVRGEQTGMSRWDDLMALKQRIGVTQDYHPQYLTYDKHLLHEEKQKGLEWAEPEPAINMGLAARFDLEEQAALQAYADYQSRMKFHPGINLTLRLGLRTKVKLEAYMEPWKFKRMSLAYEFQHNDIYMYKEGHQSDDVTYNSHAITLKLFQFDIRNLQFDIGAAWKYYHLSNLMINDNSYFYFFERENTHYFNIGFSTLSGLWRMTFPLTHSLHMQPVIFGRMIFGSDVPVWEYNMLGGNRYGIYSEHQIPFAGFSRIEFMQSKLAGVGIRFQQRLGSIGYLLLKGHVAEHDSSIANLLKNKPIWGVQGAYYYNSLIGPIGAYLSWSNHKNGVTFGLNIGYEF